MVVVAIVGMAGAGKTEVARRFAQAGFEIIRFGDITDAEVARRGLKLNESSERLVREELRQIYGPDAYARLNLPRIDEVLTRHDVVIDGLYSWSEYLFLRDEYKDQFRTLAVWAPPQVRYERLARRSVRPLTYEEASLRDRAEIENLAKCGPIVMADYMILNTSTLAELRAEAEKAMRRLRENGG